MTTHKIAIYTVIFLCSACLSKQESSPEFIWPEPSDLEKILEKGTLDVSTFYNTTDYYIYQGITRGFHYDLAQDFARYLGVKLQIIEVNNNIDSAIQRLQDNRYDLLAVSLTQTPERKEQLRFSQPLFQTGEVLVQNRTNSLVKHMADLDGKEIFIPKSATSYKNVLQQIQDSLNIHIYITEMDQYTNEDLMHLVESGEINYTIIDENVAQASRFSLKNIDYSFKLQENISVSWATPPGATLLTSEINQWLTLIRKNGKLNYLYKRYFNNHQSVPHHTSKYALLQQGHISPFDHLLQVQSKRLGWDWRLLAALVFSESRFDPEAESIVGAYGLMQIIPETAEHFKVYDYFQPDSNVYAGVSYLHYLNKYFTSYVPDSTERVKFVLAAYNAGPGHVLDAIRLADKYNKDPQTWEQNVDYYLLHKNEPLYYQDPLAKNGYCNGPQAYHYVERVLETYNNYKNIKQSHKNK